MNSKKRKQNILRKGHILITDSDKKMKKRSRRIRARGRYAGE